MKLKSNLLISFISHFDQLKRKSSVLAMLASNDTSPRTPEVAIPRGCFVYSRMRSIVHFR